jgi:SSS family solute:Na+ symporter
MIDIVVILAYFALVLVFGIVYGRNVESVFDFSIAKTQFPTSVLVATFFATIIGGASTIGASEKFYSIGLMFGAVNLAACLRDFITAQVVVPRMISFKNAISLGDIIEPVYGKAARVVCGLAGLFKCIGYVGIQISATGYVLHYFLGISHELGVIFSAIVVIVYSAFGGIRAVTITDVIQFGVLLCAIPLCFSVGVINNGGFLALIEKLPSSHLTLWPDYESGMKIMSMALVFLLPNLDPALLQRFMMGRDLAQVKRALTLSALCCVPYYIMVGTIGFSALVLAPNIDSNTAFFYIIDVGLPVGLKGIAISGLLAVVMSTADSYLNVASITIVRDILKPCLPNKLSDAQELGLMRFATAFFGVFAVVMALYIPSVYELALFALSFWGPIVFIPLLLRIIGHRPSKKTFYIGAFMSLTVFYIWRAWAQPIWYVEAFLPATAVSTLVFFLAPRLWDRVDKRQEEEVLAG